MSGQGPKFKTSAELLAQASEWLDDAAQMFADVDADAGGGSSFQLWHLAAVAKACTILLSATITASTAEVVGRLDVLIALQDQQAPGPGPIDRLRRGESPIGGADG